ncbi:RHS repeat-associated core domain-containing protein [Flavobacterium sp. HNIBRBA15423]|uniref:RHS repeat-associated core domain-containing protein n=1 Tax=Flavobacterium sp. HNIBRBA15423 TaxID=3458683 RepID=UPI0040440B35
MRKFLLLVFLFICIGSYSQTNNYHDTQGQFEVSENGQAVYTLPIALPPSIQDVGPTINLVYASGQMGGIAGQGWSISSISAIARMATRKDIDGYVDGVDFDANDKLALDGQRLQLVSGNYWEDGSVYKTEVLSNSKIELFGSETSMYFIVTSPDGSRSWYGNYGGMNAVDLTAFYIVRFEDINGNFITYDYAKPYNKSLCINEIKFSANVNGLPTSLNSIKFNYKLAKRIESAYIKGVKHEKVELLDNIEVKTNSVLFRKYQLTHIVDPQLGYERVSQLQEYNGALEAANPVIFEYNETNTQINGSEYLTSYSNNLNFNDIVLSGDFDEDGRLDFVTENKIYKNLFQNATGTTINLPFTVNKESSFTATTLSNNKLNQFQSIVKYEDGKLKVYNLLNGSAQLSYEKLFSFPFHMNCFNLIMPCDYTKTKFLEGDFNGDGISEAIMYLTCERPNEITIMNSTECDYFYWIDLNPNISSEVEGGVFAVNNAPGAVVLNNSEWLRGERYVSDYNGDGKSDILVIDKYNKNYKVISFKQLSQNPWVELEILGEGNLDKYSSTKQILFGDYNGDGKTDIMLPDTEGGSNQTLWHIYYSNPKSSGGSFFELESHNIVEYWPNTGSYYDTQIHFSSYYSLDTNGDGKSDLVRIWRKYYEPSWTINDHDTQWKVTTYVNNIGNNQLTSKFTLDYTSPCYGSGISQNCNHTSDSPDLPIPVISTFRHRGLSKDLVMVRNHYNQITYVDFTKDVSKDAQIKKVISSGGNIVDEVEYATMESSTLNNGFGNLNEFYSSSNSLNYPYVEIKRLPTNYLVSKIKNTVEGISRFQDFRYHGLQVHLHGLGSIGFKKTARSEWYQNATSKRIWTVAENRADWRGAPEKVYTQLINNGSSFSFVNSGNPSGIINSSINMYQADIVNNSYRLVLTSKETKDFVTGVTNKVEYSYDNDYLLPVAVTTKNYTTNPSNPDAIKITTTVFENNPNGLGSSYHIGRPLEVSTTTSAYGDVFSTKEIFSYANNKLVQTKKKGNNEADSDNYLIEDYEYNLVGNLIRKTISTSGYSSPQAITAPRVLEYTYDTTERFIKTSKDIEGLIATNVSFHPIYGLVTETKSPFDLTSKTEYDNWGKTIKITDYLNKNVNITYAKANNEYTVTKNGDDGSSSIEISDALGRIKKTGAKTINGNWSYKSVEYDIKGRKYKVSDPYSSAPSLWTVSTFDDYNRLLSTVAPTGLTTTLTYSGLTVTANDGTKTTSSTKNANGHVVSSSDNGGVINFKYYANGNLKESDYNGTKVRMEYDEWGRKTKLIDPSAGTYEYKQNVLGEIYYESTPNGVTNIKYDGFGKVIEKSIKGLNTNSKETFTYDTTTKLITYSKFEDFNGGFYDEYTYEYDSYKRLWRTNENRFLAFFQRATLYDDFGRPETEFYNMINTADGKQSAKWFRNTYKNGYHWQVLDNDSNHILWQTNAVNERGQLTSANYGNGIGLNQGYDQFGYLQHSRHFKDNVTPFVDVLNLYTTFEPQRGNLTSRTNSLFNWTENFQYDNLDRLTHYTNGQGIQVEQIYEDDGRIKENTIGKYNYSNTTKKYQNTSIDITAEAKAYYANRLGLFNDSMEEQVGWTTYYDPSVLSYDTTVGYTGTSSIKINNTTSSEKIIFAESWIAIDNAVPTEYTYSAWVKSDGSNPQAEVFLYMKTANETAYATTFDGVQSATSTGWVKIEKTVLVPANIKKLNIRLDNNATGVLWFDDVQIRKTSNATPIERQLNISYNVWKSPYEIHETGVDRISFTYNHLNNRSSMFYGGLEVDKMQRQYRKHYSADGSMEIKHNTLTGDVEFVTYVGGDGYTAPVVYKTDGTTGEYLFLHRDYLGSIVAITDVSGNIVEKRLFDAWGDVIKIVDGQGTTLTNFALLDRGYTGHEHLQSVGLVHMNGRLYDAKVHRFLQPDNYIQDPYNTQNYNRYGYVLNNPLKYNDPSGEEFTLLTAVVVGAIISATTYTLNAWIGNSPFSFGGLFKASFIGALSGAATFGVGEYAKNICEFGSRFVFQTIIHGSLQGTLGIVQGGDFFQGFASGSLASMASGLFSGGYVNNTDSFWNGLGGKFSQSTVGILAFGTISGGAGASLARGNFWQGAATGLTVSGLNHILHKTKSINEVKSKGGVIQTEYLGNKSFDLEGFNQALKDELIANGFSTNTIVEEYSLSKSIGYWFRGIPTAKINILSFYARGAPIDNGVAGYAALGSNSVVIYGGGSILGRYWDLDPVRLARTAVHELGHAIFSFNHSKSGVMFWQYGGGNKSGSNAFRFNTNQLEVIKNSQWGQ